MGRHTMSLWLLSTTASNHDHFPAGDFLAVRSGSGESCEKSGERRSAGKFVNATLVVRPPLACCRPLDILLGCGIYFRG